MQIKSLVYNIIILLGVAGRPLLFFVEARLEMAGKAAPGVVIIEAGNENKSSVL